MAFGAYIGEVIRQTEPKASWAVDHPEVGERTCPTIFWGSDASFPCT